MPIITRASSWHQPHGGVLSDCLRRIRDAETALADARWSLTDYLDHGEGGTTAVRNKCRSRTHWITSRAQSKKSSPHAETRGDVPTPTMPPPLKRKSVHRAATHEAGALTPQADRARRAANLTDEDGLQEKNGFRGNLLLQRLNSGTSCQSIDEAPIVSSVSDWEIAANGTDSANGRMFVSGGRCETSLSRGTTRTVEDTSAQPNYPASLPRAYSEAAFQESEQPEPRGVLKHAIFDQVVIAQSLFNTKADAEIVTPYPARDPARWSSLVPTPTMKSSNLGYPKQLSKGQTKLWQAKRDWSWANCGSCYVPVLNPASKQRLVWLFIGLALIVYEAFAVPLLLAFRIQPEGFFLVLAHLITVFFILDVIVTFFTGYVNRAGHLVFSLDRIAWRYVRTWLLLDVIAAIPWIWISPESVNQQLTRSTKIVRFTRLVHVFRLARIFRMMKLKSVTDTLEMFLEANQTVLFAAGVFRVVAWLCAAMHWCACLWYAVGSQAGLQDTWIKSLPIVDLTTTESYVWSMYFTMTTMTTVGYGDIHPTNYGECCFALVLLPVSSVLFATLMGALTTLISNINHKHRKIAEKRLALTRYLNWRTVPTYLKIRMRQHLLFLWDMKEGYDVYEEELKSLLPPVLKAELCYHLYGNQLYRAPFLEWLKEYPICLKNLASMVDSIYLERGDHLFREGDANEQVYMLLKGTMWLSLNQNLYEGAENSEKEPSRDPSGAASDFSIPQKTDGRFMLEVGMAVSKMVKANRKNKERTDGLGATTSASIFDSAILLEAGLKLHMRRSAEFDAALVVQRWWRKAKERKRANGGSAVSPVSRKALDDSPDKRHANRPPRGPLLLSQQISSPAYFGESCLWVPLDMWDNVPLPYKYTARCVERAEFLHIPRSALQVVIRQFSPWLAARFNIFREAVLEGLMTRAGEESRGYTSEDESNRPHPIQNGKDASSTPKEEKSPLTRKRSVSFSDDAPRAPLVQADTLQLVDATDSSELPGRAADAVS